MLHILTGSEQYKSEKASTNLYSHEGDGDIEKLLIVYETNLNNFKVRQASTIIWTMGKVWILQMKSHEYGMRSIKTNINKYLDMLHVGLNKKCWALGQNGYPRDI